MPRRSSVAQPKEVLQALSRIMRGEAEAKPAKILRAAEMLGKHYGLFGGEPQQLPEAPQIVIDIPADT